MQGPKKQAKPHGRALPAGQTVTYDVDARGAEEAPRQLEVTRPFAGIRVCPVCPRRIFSAYLSQLWLGGLLDSTVPAHVHTRLL